MKTIIIHHVQAMWNEGLNRFGTDFDTELQKVYEHLQENDYDRVIVTNFEAGFGLDSEQWILQEFCPEVYEYGYGWDRSMLCSTLEEGLHYAEGGNHSEIVMLDGWMHELSGEVFLCGAFDGECIEDMEIALEAAGKDFTRLDHLIV